MSRPERTFDAGDLTPDLYHCSGCSYCVDAIWPERGIEHVCVTLEHHESSPAYSGMGYLAQARALAAGESLDAQALAKRVFTCTLCGNCEAVCPIGMRPAGVVMSLRRWLAAEGAIPAQVATAREAVRAAGNAYGEAPRNEAAADPGTDSPAARVTLFAGCALRLRAPAELAAMRTLLDAAGIDYAFAGTNEPCCGAALAALGADGDAEEFRARALRGARSTLMAGAADCRGHLEGAHDDVHSFVDWLTGAVDAGHIELTPRALPPRVGLVESCRMREGNAQAALRALLERLGVTVATPRFPNPHAMCCGAGGAMPVAAPEAAARMARARIDGALTEAGSDAIDVLLSPDPTCLAHLAASNVALPVAGPATFLVQHFTVSA